MRFRSPKTESSQFVTDSAWFVSWIIQCIKFLLTTSVVFNLLKGPRKTEQPSPNQWTQDLYTFFYTVYLESTFVISEVPQMAP